MRKINTVIPEIKINNNESYLEYFTRIKDSMLSKHFVRFDENGRLTVSTDYLDAIDRNLINEIGDILFLTWQIAAMAIDEVHNDFNDGLYDPPSDDEDEDDFVDAPEYPNPTNTFDRNDVDTSYADIPRIIHDIYDCDLTGVITSDETYDSGNFPNNLQWVSVIIKYFELMNELNSFKTIDEYYYDSHRYSNYIAKYVILYYTNKIRIINYSKFQELNDISNIIGYRIIGDFCDYSTTDLEIDNLIVDE